MEQKKQAWNGENICPPAVRRLMAVFAAAGERAYPVGGCVRDTLMGLAPHDWDLAVTTTPDRTQALCEAAGWRVIPTGMAHGTVTALVPDETAGDGHREPLECTTCRTEGGYADGRHPDAVTFTARIEDDLSRRDFTVNAMAFTERTEDGTPMQAPAPGLALIDLFGGREDLRNGVIRCVGDPDTRFAEDALRMLRAVRFTVRLDFRMEPATFAAVVRGAPRLERISRERISSEFRLILTGAHPDRGLCMLAETGLLPVILPHVTVSPLKIGELPPRFPLRLAAVLWGNDPDTVRRALDGLRLPNREEQEIGVLLSGQSADVTVADAPAARRLRSVYGDLTADVLRLCAHGYRAAGDGNSKEPGAASLAENADRLASLSEASRAAGDCVTIRALAVNGGDVRSWGFPETARNGRMIGVILAALLEAVLDDPACNTPDRLRAAAERFLKDR